ncbi:hypothetical protein QN277_017310 [Acacia crassicarpa]|uniref:RNase H type-1 domain-containing protein n=1 Tax=Acacia crassicarpa TaxID=499986 RepID=A0AAE1JTP2_9FABA|nr:hypothetical protein QN277_017310 [Acacia crassicarpa]
MLLGLNLAWDEGFRRVLVESDSRILVMKLLQRKHDRYSTMVYQQIIEMLARDWEVKIAHVPRIQNALADGLAKEGLKSSSILSNCPRDLWRVLSNECMGLVPQFSSSNI